MKSRFLRIVILFFAGLSVSIVPVRAHYALTTQGDSAARSSSLLPRSQQRIRIVSMRIVTIQPSRISSRNAKSGEACSRFTGKPVSEAPSGATAARFTDVVQMRCLVRPLRC
jgi:hypothetical protein